MATIAPWKVHGDGRKVGPTEVVAPDERLAWPQTLGLGAQHVLAMFGATFLVPLLVGFPPNTTIFFSGIGTLIFLIVTIGRGQRLGLPSYLGSSFAFISPVIVAKEQGGIPAAIGLIMGAGNLIWTFDHGNVSFNGIALGTFAVIIAYQVMKYVSRFGLFHDGEPAEPLSPATLPPTKEKIEPHRSPGAAV
jgi:xanthine/uracil permease